MGCSNCFNGCADIVSDQCVKYTGVFIPGLGINPGDPLLLVENQIIKKILELMTGEGVVPVIDPADLCPIISTFLPSSGTITLNDVISALFKSICAINSRLTTAEGKLITLNADYVIGCLTGVVPSSGTHAILQATITKLCSVSSSLTTLTAELLANYVLINDIDDYIEAYIASTPVSTLYSDKMIPYVAVPYFGVLTGFFDVTGAGLGQWAKIYLCNGQNLTPDLRGRVLVGTTTMGNTAFNPAVNPAIAGNPTYSLNTVTGANLATLTSPTQLPPHTHTATAVVSPNPHSHTYNNIKNAGADYEAGNDFRPAEVNGTIASSATALSVAVTVGSTGVSEGHNNIQPVHATNYIIYIP